GGSEVLAQPGLVVRDVDERRRSGEVGVAGGDRLVDPRMLLPGEVEGVAVGEAVPQTRAHGPRREAAQKRLKNAVPRSARDHVVERRVRLDELVGAVSR